jgi:restriction system protein
MGLVMEVVRQHGIDIVRVLVGVFIFFHASRIYFRHRKKVRLLRCDIYDIDELSGEDFELFLYYFFRKHGYRVRLTPRTHDFGADLVIRHRRKRIVIQAKRWKERVGIKAVQEVIGSLAYYEAKQGMVFTNSYYTKSAVILAQSNGITLVGRNALKRMIKDDHVILPE